MVNEFVKLKDERIMKKIIIINGSPRNNGATAKLLNKMVEYLRRKNDVEVSIINVSDYSLQNCTGCMSCYRNAICCFNDNVEQINKMIFDADGVVIGSPTYSSSMPGSLKTYIDRGHFVLEQALSGKYTFALNTYEIAGGDNVISELKTLYRYAGGILSGSYICKLPFNSSPFLDAKLESKLLQKTEKYYQSIKSNKTKSLLDKIIHFIALHIIMKPQVLKRPEQYQAVIKRWKTIGIIK